MGEVPSVRLLEKGAGQVQSRERAFSERVVLVLSQHLAVGATSPSHHGAQDMLPICAPADKVGPDPELEGGCGQVKVAPITRCIPLTIPRPWPRV